MNTLPDKVVIAAGEFVDEREVQSLERAIIDLSALKVTHEEADTLLIVHCVNSSLNSIVVSKGYGCRSFLSQMFLTVHPLP